MEQKDFLMREIEKLLQLLKSLISKVSGLNSVNFEIGIKQVNDNLITQFDLSLDKLISIKKLELIKIIKNVDKVNIELLIELLSEIIYKIEKLERNSEYDINELGMKVIILIDYLDSETKTLSIERMIIKMKLQNWILKDE